MNEAIKDRQSTDKHTDADIVLALRPESRPTEIAPEARKDIAIRLFKFTFPSDSAEI